MNGIKKSDLAYSSRECGLRKYLNTISTSFGILYLFHRYMVFRQKDPEYHLA